MKTFIKNIVILITFLFCKIVNAQHQSIGSVDMDMNKRQKVVVEIQADKYTLNPAGSIRYVPIKYLGIKDWSNESIKAGNHALKFEMEIDEPIYLELNDLFKPEPKKRRRINFWLLMEAGDNVVINFSSSGVTFSGKGSEKMELKLRLDSLKRNIPTYLIKRDSINFKNYKIESKADFNEWYKFLSKNLEIGIEIIDQYKMILSPFAYNLIKATFVNENIDDQFDKFYALNAIAEKQMISSQEICTIYDSIYLPLTQKWIKYSAPFYIGNQAPVINRVYRKFLFARNQEPLNSALKLNLLFYREALKIYSDTIREQFIVTYLPENIIRKFGFTDEVEELLAQYYNEPGYASYKNYMKKQEWALREKINALIAPELELTDREGRTFKTITLKGKIAVLNFWKVGNSDNDKLGFIVRSMEQKFKKDSNVIFVNIAVDKDKNTSVISKYAITKFPAIRVLDADGRVLKHYVDSSSETDKGKYLTDILIKNLAISKDGPYVFTSKSGIKSYSINSKIPSVTDDPGLLSVRTDLNTTFTVRLRKTLKIEPAEYNRPQKLIVLSDIEGNFDSFRKLLQASRIVDDKFNWIFGNGHLVFAGDMFDRGNQVTECLWLMYSLEEKAKAAGGYVHFILGNHEIMNLQGDDRYVTQKYKDNAKLLGKSIKQLYNEESELGRWLRTKNIVEKIGDLLFMHGGVSPEVNRQHITIDEINKIARPFYSIKKEEYADEKVNVVMSSRTSPFWYRMYYEQGSNSLPATVIDSTLTKFNVRQIITGHTIVADTISVHFGGKVINTDTKHAEGKSEALLIEGPNYYRVNDKGERKLLFIETEDKKKIKNTN